MGKINWVRVFLCGFVTGAISWLLQVGVFVYVLPDTELRAAVEATHRPTWAGLHIALYIAAGIWTLWLYAAIRPRYGAGPKTAVVAGLGLWTIGAIIDGIWGSVGIIPLHALAVPLAVVLPICVAGTLAGAWLYKE